MRKTIHKKLHLNIIELIVPTSQIKVKKKIYANVKEGTNYLHVVVNIIRPKESENYIAAF